MFGTGKSIDGKRIGRDELPLIRVSLVHTESEPKKHLKEGLAPRGQPNNDEAFSICVNPPSPGLRRDTSCVHFTPEDFGAAVDFDWRAFAVQFVSIRG